MTDLDTFAQPADVATYTQGQIPEDDPRLPGALAAVTAMIRRWAGWHIAPSRTETITLDGDGGRELDLPSKYVTAISSISENGSDPLDESAYSWSQLGLVWLRDRQLWTRRLGGISVNLTHGYATVPADLTQVTLAILTRQITSPLGVVREQTLSASVTWSQVAPGVAGGLALLPHEMALLEPFRIETP